MLEASLHKISPLEKQHSIFSFDLCPLTSVSDVQRRHCALSHPDIMLTFTVSPYWFGVNQCSAVTYVSNTPSKKRWMPQNERPFSFDVPPALHNVWLTGEWVSECHAVEAARPRGHRDSQSVVSGRGRTKLGTYPPLILQLLLWLVGIKLLKKVWWVSKKAIK